jgi:hypothetical protein
MLSRLVGIGAQDRRQQFADANAVCPLPEPMLLKDSG